MSTQAAIFDLDDTLYLERDYVRSGYRAVGEHLRAMGRTGTFERWLWARFERGQAAGAFDAMNEHFALGLSPADIAALVEVYRNHRPTIAPLPGIVELLSLLRPQYALGLLADGALPAQRLKLAALKLERFFDAVVFTEEIGRDAWKPSPVGFELMQRKMGTVPLAYISDNPAKDFVAPNRLGWRTIQLLYPGQVHAGNAAPEGGRAQFIVRLPGEVVAALREIR